MFSGQDWAVDPQNAIPLDRPDPDSERDLPSPSRPLATTQSRRGLFLVVAVAAVMGALGGFGAGYSGGLWYGFHGPQGVPGKAGAQGKIGAQGQQGVPGVPGPAGDVREALDHATIQCTTTTDPLGAAVVTNVTMENTGPSYAPQPGALVVDSAGLSTTCTLSP